MSLISGAFWERSRGDSGSDDSEMKPSKTVHTKDFQLYQYHPGDRRSSDSPADLYPTT